MNSAGQSVWVLGAGFLGSSLAAALRARGHSVLTLDAHTPADVQGDAADPAVLRRMAELSAPGWIVCALSTRGGGAGAYREVYAGTVAALQEVCPSARLIFCSSVSVYGDTAGAEVTEDSPALSSGPAAQVLREVESSVLRANGLVLRLAALYGPGRCELLRRHLAGEPTLPGPAERLLNYLHVEDATAAILHLLELAPAAGIFNLCSETLSHAAAYELLRELTGRPVADSASAPGKRGSGNRRVSVARLRALGWQPAHSLADFIRTSAESS